MKHHIIRLTGLLSILVLAAATMAGTWSTNNFFYQPAVGARGSEEKKEFDAGLARVDAHLGKYKTLGDPGYATIAEALTTIGSNNVALTVPSGTWDLSANTTFPTGVTLVFLKGGMINRAGHTLTINGHIVAGPWQIFTGSGTVTIARGAAAQKYPHWWGIDGSSDDVAFQAALDSGTGVVFLPGGDYSTSATFTIGNEDHLVLAPDAEIMPDSDIDVVQIARGGKFEGGEIDVGGVATYSKAAVTVVPSGAGDYVEWGIFNTRLRSSGDRGTGIKMYSSTAEGQITWFRGEHLTINNFNICLDMSSENGSWVTANYFNDLQLNGVYGIKLYKVGGSSFKGIIMQTQASSQKALQMDNCDHCTVEFFPYDWNVAASPIGIKLGQGTNNCSIYGAGFLNSRISDYGYDNTWFGFSPVTYAAPQVLRGMFAPSAYAKPSFLGRQDDYLTFVDKKGGSVSADKGLSSGALSNLFDLNPNNYAEWDAADCPVEIEITLPGTLTAVNALGLCFRLSSYSADGIKIETYAGGSWKTWKTFTSHGYEEAWALAQEVETDGADTNVEKIRITISDPTSSAVRLERVWLYQVRKDPEAFLPVYQPKVYDKLQVNNTVTNTNTPSGATAKAWPIYDHNGVLLGYIPVYESQW